jgi:hypothetical protein
VLFFVSVFTRVYKKLYWQFWRIIVVCFISRAWSLLDLLLCLIELYQVTKQYTTLYWISEPPRAMLKFMIQMGCFHFCFQKVDLYSLGIIFFEMCYRPLVTGMERVKVLVNLRNSMIILPPDFTEDGRSQQIHIIRYVLWFLCKFKLWIINLDINFTSDIILVWHHFIIKFVQVFFLEW